MSTDLPPLPVGSNLVEIDALLALRVAEEISEDREKDEVVATQLNNLAVLLKAMVWLDGLRC